MPSASTFKLGALLAAAIICAAAIQAWRTDRRDRAQLAAELAAAKQLLTAADARQRDRDAQLAQTLSALEAQKRAITTPAQILRELPKSLPLPAPITLQGGQASSVGATLGSPTPDRANASAGPASAAPPNADKPAPPNGSFLEPPPAPSPQKPPVRSKRIHISDGAASRFPENNEGSRPKQQGSGPRGNVNGEPLQTEDHFLIQFPLRQKFLTL